MVSNRGSSSIEVRPVGGSVTNSDGALAERGPVRVALHHGSHDLRQSQPGLADRRGDRLAGPGGGELAVVGVHIGDAALEPLFTGISRHIKLRS